MSRSSVKRSNYKHSKHKKVFDLLQEVKEIEVLESDTDSCEPVRDLDGVWRPANQLKYKRYQEEEGD